MFSNTIKLFVNGLVAGLCLTVFLGILSARFIRESSWWQWKNQVFECPPDTVLSERAIEPFEKDKIRQLCVDAKTGVGNGPYIIRYKRGPVTEIGFMPQPGSGGNSLLVHMRGDGFTLEEPKCERASTATDLQGLLSGGKWTDGEKRYTSQIISVASSECPSGKALIMKEEESSPGLPSATSTYCIEEEGLTLGVPEHPRPPIKMGH